MTTAAGNLFLRDDTLFGVCQGLGEEFGFNANYLRVTLGALLLWNAAAVVGVYLALGVVLAVSRRIWPVSSSVPPADCPAAPVAGNDAAAPVLARAA